MKAEGLSSDFPLQLAAISDSASSDRRPKVPEAVARPHSTGSLSIGVPLQSEGGGREKTFPKTYRDSTEDLRGPVRSVSGVQLRG